MECSDENLPDSSCHFWQQISAFLQILHQPSVPSNITSLYLFSSNIIYFGQKQLIKVRIFEIFKCLGQNLLNSSSQFWSYESILQQILHHSPVSWRITPLYFFRSNIIYFARKGPNKFEILETFECLDQNSCHFLSNKLVFLQILRHSSVSWNITPLYFFSWNFIYF